VRKEHPGSTRRALASAQALAGHADVLSDATADGVAGRPKEPISRYHLTKTATRNTSVPRKSSPYSAMKRRGQAMVAKIKHSTP